MKSSRKDAKVERRTLRKELQPMKFVGLGLTSNISQPLISLCPLRLYSSFIFWRYLS
jgi:hypothetical protein